MMRSLFSGVSGLKNHQTRMDVIGNNISNVNTTGFKSSRATFVDMLSQTLTGASSPNDNVGGTNPKQIGLGSSVASIDLLFSDGSVQSTGKNTDLCLSGNGLFVVSNSADGTNKLYTRNGNFSFDADGNYVQAGSGYFVQGWMADKGSLSTTGATTKIQIPSGKPMESEKTTSADYTNNLRADIPTITQIIPGMGTLPGTVRLSDGSSYSMITTGLATGMSLPVTTTLTMYDSLGVSHDIAIYFTKEPIDTAADPPESSWRISVNSDGSASKTYTEGTQTTTVDMPAETLKFDENGKFKEGAGLVTMTLTDGSGTPQQVTLNLSSLTQYAGSNTVSGKANGHAAGSLESVSIDQSGIITGTYSNGVRQTEAQVAVAQFNNAAGLTKTGDSYYQESNNSGVANIKTAADLGCKITPAALEMSNVDVANEFTDMIITQRGFQSNSKIITTSDEMLETLINLKR
ncbi:MAG: flagellar hook protein FlgE [Schwartzia sp.]|nr:flagellar hook protein FlgE [Schwartzia sp. (in: firmicutes)]